MLGRWFDVYAFPIDAPEHCRVAILFNDISARKQHEEHAQFLMQEVNHRAKNMLTLVDAVAKQTASVGREDFLERFSERLRGLAAGQDLLVRAHWTSADLFALLESQLIHFRELMGHRIALDGPRLDVSPRAAQTLGMAFHELATNAAKYGALSNDKGRVEVEWRIQEGSGSLFSISWKETDGPPVNQPTRTGFGQRVCKSITESALSAQVSLTYARSGLVWTLSCPPSAIKAS